MKVANGLSEHTKRSPRRTASLAPDAMGANTMFPRRVPGLPSGGSCRACAWGHDDASRQPVTTRHSPDVGRHPWPVVCMSGGVVGSGGDRGDSEETGGLCTENALLQRSARATCTVLTYSVAQQALLRGFCGTPDIGDVCMQTAKHQRSLGVGLGRAKLGPLRNPASP